MDMKKLAALAGLAEDATDEQIVEALGKKLAAPPPPPPAPAPVTLSDAQVTQLAERLGITKLGEQIAATAKEHANAILAAERKTNRVMALLERGQSEGKITPAMRKATVDGKETDPVKTLAEANPDAFEAWLEKAPKLTPTPGTMGRFELTRDSLAEGKALEAGAFSKVDLSDAKTRLLLHSAAEKLVAEKKAADYAAATVYLTQPSYSEQAQ